MLFETPSERDQYFTRWAEPNLGAAMRHARETYLGIWGNTDALEEDCARILIREMRHVLICASDNRDEIKWRNRRVGIEDVRWNEVFRRAFDDARRPSKTEAADALESLIGFDNVNPDLRRALDYERHGDVPVEDKRISLIMGREQRPKRQGIPDQHLARLVLQDMRVIDSLRNQSG